MSSDLTAGWVAAGATLAMLLAGPAVAQSTSAVADSGFYVAARGGLNFLLDVDASLGQVGTIDLDYSPGYHLGGAVGYEFGGFSFGALRVEAEFQRQRHGLKDAEFISDLQIPIIDPQITGTLGAGKISALTLNALADFAPSWPVRPFIGAGVGIAWAELDDIGGTVNVVGPISVTATFSDDTDLLAAGQLLAGLGVPLTERVTFSTSYRAFVTSEASFTFDLPVVQEERELESILFTQALVFELRYRF